MARISNLSRRPNSDNLAATYGAQKSMQVDPYITLAKALERAGLTAQRTRPDQLIVSAQEGPVWPNRGNSFWLSQIEGTWYLSTWLPVCYRVPQNQDIVGICLACMAAGTSATYRVPPEISARFELQEIDERQYERLFPTEGETD
jgi:hypothetical protein